METAGRELSIGSAPTQDARLSRGSVFSLARPWKFPAGHADSLYRRRHARLRVQIPIGISLVRPDGSSYDDGTGVITDLSWSGVRLGEVILSRGRLLVRCFHIQLCPPPEPSADQGIVGRILRTFSSGIPGFGIEFLFPGPGMEEWLRKMTGGASADDPGNAALTLSEEPWRDQPT